MKSLPPTLVVATLFFAALAGCPEQTTAPVIREHASDAVAPAPPAPAPASAVDALGKLDHRAAVPLTPMMAWHQKQNMMDHLAAIQEVTDALAKEDWEGVARASKRIETSPQMEQMCKHMGAGTPGFTPDALDFHRRADAIAKAARAHDAKATLSATSNTLRACTNCHAKYRQEVVDESTWQVRTGQTEAPAPHGHAPGMHPMH